MRTFRITPDNDRFQLGGQEFLLPRGEAVALDSILDHLNAQTENPFLKFYAGAGEGIAYSVLDQGHTVKVLRGRVEL